MILSFLLLVVAAVVALVLVPLAFVYSGWSLFLVVAGFLITATFLLCYIGHVHTAVYQHLRRRWHR
jgi:hypothetical protein